MKLNKKQKIIVVGIGALVFVLYLRGEKAKRDHLVGPGGNIPPPEKKPIVDPGHAYPPKTQADMFGYMSSYLKQGTFEVTKDTLGFNTKLNKPGIIVRKGEIITGKIVAFSSGFAGGFIEGIRVERPYGYADVPLSNLKMN